MKTSLITQPQNPHAPFPQRQRPAQLVQRPRRWGLVAVALALFSAAWLQAGPATEDLRHQFTPPGARDITILDQNLYVGSEFTPIMTLDPTDTNYVYNLLRGVAQVYQTIAASDFPKRAQALAREIAVTRPDLVALQEVSLIRSQVPGDLLLGGTTPASDVQLDYLAILLANLNRHVP